MAAPVKARTCEYCGKVRGVTFHVLWIEGKATSAQMHPACFRKHRRAVDEAARRAILRRGLLGSFDDTTDRSIRNLTRKG